MKTSALRLDASLLFTQQALGEVDPEAHQGHPHAKRQRGLSITFLLKKYSGLRTGVLPPKPVRMHHGGMAEQKKNTLTSIDR